MGENIPWTPNNNIPDKDSGLILTELRSAIQSIWILCVGFRKVHDRVATQQRRRHATEVEIACVIGPV